MVLPSPLTGLAPLEGHKVVLRPLTRADAAAMEKVLA